VTAEDRELLHQLVDAVVALQRRALREERTNLRHANLSHAEMSSLEQRIDDSASGGLADLTVLLEDIRLAKIEAGRLRRR
jgi:hypothetical protein